jgi:hypothetical protein
MAGHLPAPGPAEPRLQPGPPPELQESPLRELSGAGSVAHSWPGRGAAAGAADSLRWAEQALTLADAGIIDDGQMMACEDHLVTLWLLSDSALADQVTRRQLGALTGLTDKQRHRLTEIFGAWLETRGTAADITGRLCVHPQTVRS